MNTEDIELPPLPKASKMYDIYGYDEEELKDYARTAIQAERAALAEKDKEIAKLREALREASAALDQAREDVACWGSYAGEYFQDKHDLGG